MIRDSNGVQHNEHNEEINTIAYDPREHNEEINTIAYDPCAGAYFSDWLSVSPGRCNLHAFIQMYV